MLRAEVHYSKLAVIIGDFASDQIKTFAEHHSVLISCQFTTDNLHTLLRMIPKEQCSLVNIWIKKEDYKENEIIFDTFVSIISKHKFVKLNIKDY